MEEHTTRSCDGGDMDSGHFKLAYSSETDSHGFLGTTMSHSHIDASITSLRLSERSATPVGAKETSELHQKPKPTRSFG